MERTTIRDIAREAHTSVSTVSRVLNGSNHIAPETRELVTGAIQRLNYIPDSRARGMRLQQTNMLGFLIPDITNRYFALLAQVVKGTLVQSGYLAFLGVTSESEKVQDLYASAMLAQHIDGALIVPQGKQSSSLQQLLDSEIPIVLIDRPLEGRDDIPLVDSDPLPGMIATITDFKEHGHKNIGYIAGPVTGAPALALRSVVFRKLAAEIAGFDKVLVDTTHGGQRDFDLRLGNEYDGIIFDKSAVGHYGMRSTVIRNRVSSKNSLTIQTMDNSYFAEYMDRIGQVLTDMMNEGVTAILFGYSPDAIVALTWLSQQNIKVGVDLSIASFDDLEIFSLYTPQVAAIAQPVIQMGMQAAATIIDRVNGGVVSSSRIPTMYLHRDSVGDAPNRS